MSHGGPVCAGNYLQNSPHSFYILIKLIIGLGFAIYSARKARDPARGVDGAMSGRRDKFSTTNIGVSTDREVTGPDFQKQHTLWSGAGCRPTPFVIRFVVCSYWLYLFRNVCKSRANASRMFENRIQLGCFCRGIGTTLGRLFKKTNTGQIGTYNAQRPFSFSLFVDTGSSWHHYTLSF